MKRNPTVSVVMSVFNESRVLLDRAVRSILCQTFSDFEFIVIIDNPANREAVQLLEEIRKRDVRVRVLMNDRNRGLSYSLNKAVKLARGRLIARQDADDASHPHRLERQVAYLEAHPEIDVIGTGLNYIDEKGRLLLQRCYKGRFSTVIKRRSPLAHPTILARIEAFEKGGFYQDDNYVSDYELWIRWFLAGINFRIINDILYDYHQRPDNIKRNARAQLLSTIRVKWKYHRKLHFNILDYVYLIIECLMLLIPQKCLFPMFVVSHRIRHGIVR